MSKVFDDLMGDVEVRSEEFAPLPGQSFNPAAGPQAPQQGMSLGEMWSTARELDSTVAATARLLNEPDFAPVTGYTVQEMPRLLEGIPQDMQPVLAEYLYDNSVSPEHSTWLKDKWVNEVEQESRLAQEGWVGLGVRLGVNIFDEGAIALSLATGGVGAALGYGAKAGRLVNAARLAGVSAGENMGLEAYLAQANATRTTGDILIAGLGGAIIGGGLGAAFGKRASKVVEDGNAGRARDTSDAISDAEVRDAGGMPRPEVAPESAARVVELDETPRRTAEQDAEAKALEAKLGAARKEVELTQKKIRGRVEKVRKQAPKQPEQPQTVARARSLRAELDDLKAKVADAPTPAHRTQADQQLQVFKRKLASESGAFDSKNPKLEQVEAHVKRLEAAAKKDAAKYDSDLKLYNTRVDQIDSELKGLKEADAQLSKRLGETEDEARSVGAAQAGQEDADITDTTLMNDIYKYEQDNPPVDSWMANAKLMGVPLRPSVYASVQRSDNTIYKRLGNFFLEDGVGKEGDGVSMITATEITDSDMMQYQYHFMKAAKRDFKEWKRNNGISRFNNSDSTRRKFFEDVSDAIESGAGRPDVQATAKAFSDVTAHVHAKARAAGLGGWDQFDARTDYLPHMHNFEKIADFAATHQNTTPNKMGPFEDLLFRSMRESGNELDDEILQKIVETYSKTVRRISAGDGMPLRFANLPNATHELLAESLKDIGLDVDDINDVLRTLTANDAKKGRVKHAKNRTLLNMETTGSYRSTVTGEMETFKLSDFFERDASMLLQGYVNNVNGWATIAKLTKDTPYHMTNMADVERLLELGAREGVQAGQNAKKLAKTARMLRQSVNRALGRSIIENPNGFLGKTVRYSTDYTFTTSMGQVVWSQTAEWGNVVGQNSWKHLLREIPGLKEFVKGAGTTKFDDEFHREIKDFWGFGTDRIRHNISSRYDVDTGGGMNVAKTKIDSGMEKVKGTVAAPMHWMMDIQHRVSMGAGMRGWADAAFGKKMSKAATSRLRDYGIDDAMAEKIHKNIRKHATNETGGRPVDGDTVARFNFEAWDEDAANALKYGMARRERRIIQENTFGTSWDMANNALGRVVFQFRGFIMNAYEKMLLHGVKHHDAQTFASFMASMFFAGSAYVGMIHTRTLGMSEKDRKKYLAERLTDEKIGSAAFARAGFASILPTMYDTVAQAAGFDPQFDVRSTGYSASLASGIPAVAAADKAVNVQQALIGLAHGDSWSSSDWYQFKSLLPMNNLIGVQNMMNLIGQ